MEKLRTLRRKCFVDFNRTYSVIFIIVKKLTCGFQRNVIKDNSDREMQGQVF
jgi:hypothetical protein